MVYFFIKRLFDILVSIVGIIFLLPLSLIIKICYIIIGDFNSIFYFQERVGKNGEIFKIIKFRTMVIDADKILDNLLLDEKYSKQYYCAYKINDDPRITKIGHILRRLSIDEFPQFINVLVGHMSLVGPRPVIKKELNMYKKNKNLLLSVRPGLTGNWVINGRNNITYDERVKFEVEYVKNMSLLFDLKIMFKTFICVFSKRGAL